MGTVREIAAALQQVIISYAAVYTWLTRLQMMQDTSTTVKETAEDLNSLQDSTATTKENAQIAEALTNRLQDDLMIARETVHSLTKPLKNFAKALQTLQMLAMIAASLWLISTFLGRRYGQCLTLFYSKHTHRFVAFYS
jgi:uncharacterized protein YoxC